MIEKLEKIIDEKINELSEKENLNLEEISFLMTQLERKEMKKFQQENKEMMINLMQTM